MRALARLRLRPVVGCVPLPRACITSVLRGRLEGPHSFTGAKEGRPAVCMAWRELAKREALIFANCRKSEKDTDRQRDAPREELPEMERLQQRDRELSRR